MNNLGIALDATKFDMLYSMLKSEANGQDTEVSIAARTALEAADDLLAGLIGDGMNRVEAKALMWAIADFACLDLLD